jgi:hypothetical protein
MFSSLFAGVDSPFQHTRPASNGKSLTRLINYATRLDPEQSALQQAFALDAGEARA